jgi:hypothetical protein
MVLVVRFSSLHTTRQPRPVRRGTPVRPLGGGAFMRQRLEPADAFPHRGR